MMKIMNQTQVQRAENLPENLEGIKTVYSDCVGRQQVSLFR